jgi:RND superfamily putative drug exporter
MTIVPAVTTLLGSRTWWLPRWLDRTLPNLDAEGAHLAAQARIEDPEPLPATH